MCVQALMHHWIKEKEARAGKCSIVHVVQTLFP